MAAATALVLLGASYASGQPAPLSDALHRLTGNAPATSDPATASGSDESASDVSDSPSATPTKATRSASPKPPADPTVSWKFPTTTVDRGKDWTFTYDTTAVAGTSRGIELQRKNEDGGWRGVENLTRASGAHSRGAPPLGRSSFRLVVTDPAQSGALATTDPVTITTYAPVSLETLLQSGIDTVSVNGRLFPYAYNDEDCGRDCSDVAEPIDVLTIHDNTCRSIHLVGVALRPDGSTDGAVAPVLSLQQVDRPEVTHSFTERQVETLDSAIDSPDWSLSWKAPNLHTTDFYLNGSASCWSEDGVDPDA